MIWHSLLRLRSPFFVLSLVILFQAKSYALTCQENFEILVSSPAENSAPVEATPELPAAAELESSASASGMIANAEAFLNQDLDAATREAIKKDIRSLIVDDKHIFRLPHYKDAAQAIYDMRSRLPKLNKLDLKGGMLTGLPKDIATKLDKYFSAQQIQTIIEQMIAGFTNPDLPELHEKAPRTITRKYVAIKKLIDSFKGTISENFFEKDGQVDLQRGLEFLTSENLFEKSYSEVGIPEGQLEAYLKGYIEVYQRFDGKTDEINSHVQNQIYYKRRAEQIAKLLEKPYGASLLRAILLQTLPHQLNTMMKYQDSTMVKYNSDKGSMSNHNYWLGSVGYISFGYASVMPVMLVALDFIFTGGLGSLAWGAAGAVGLAGTIQGFIRHEKGQTELRKRYSDFYKGEIDAALTEAWAQNLEEHNQMAAALPTETRGKTDGIGAKTMFNLYGIANGLNFGGGSKPARAALPAPQSLPEGTSEIDPKNHKVQRVKKSYSLEDLETMRAGIIARIKGLGIKLTGETKEENQQYVLDLTLADNKATKKRYFPRVIAALKELRSLHKVNQRTAELLSPQLLDSLDRIQAVLSEVKKVKLTEKKEITEQEKAELVLSEEDIQTLEAITRYQRTYIAGVGQISRYVSVLTGLVVSKTSPNITKEDLGINRVFFWDRKVDIMASNGKLKDLLSSLAKVETGLNQLYPTDATVSELQRMEELVEELAKLRQPTALMTQQHMQKYFKAIKEFEGILASLRAKIKGKFKCKSTSSCY